MNATRSPSPRFAANGSSDVLSLVEPDPLLEASFASIHHCAFWATG